MDGVNAVSSWLTWNNAGILMTFIGTGLSFWQAWRAKGYKDEIKSERARITLHDIIPRAKSVKEECKKITTPVDINNPLRGVNHQGIIDAIEGFCEYLEENNHRLDGVVNLSENIMLIKAKVQEYKANQQPMPRYTNADIIYENLNHINVELARARDGA